MHQIQSYEKFLRNSSEKRCERCCKIICFGPNSRYIQPPREKILKPIEASHLSTKPFAGETVYQKSFNGVSGQEMLRYRRKAMTQSGEIHKAEGTMPHDTIFTLSYQPNIVIRRTPILPKNRTHISNEPLESLTTHMHDFLPKYMANRSGKIIHEDNLKTLPGKFSGDTVNRLSYSVPIGVTKVKCLKPKIDYQMPTESLDDKTVYKLSYGPTQMPLKEFYPWMRKERAIVVNTPMARETVYRKSYIPNSGYQPSKPIIPAQGGQLFHIAEKFKPNSIYQLSYSINKIDRVLPIVPKGEIELTQTKKFEDNTIHKLSYLPPVIDARRQSLRPVLYSVTNSERMESVTTHMRDFIPKTTNKILPLKPKKSEMCIKDIDVGELSTATIQNLSYMAPNMAEFQPAKSCKPISKEYRSGEPFDGRTVNKLSFLPPPTGFHTKTIPCIKKESTQQSSAKMSKDTIHKLSFLPPGQINDDTCCSCKNPILSCDQDEYPKAAI
ncbi:uncharacterized protein LOC132265153 [Phlebotomus argentipes]|uniref:uncharacterized protein LOC132265153 n=1 Tax=Phlebotomus argentipes TaxID=94469 RepID=UPI00289361E6|nr:uncharacterized protein LOC132265153 [Phlebotomus argentipes]